MLSRRFAILLILLAFVVIVGLLAERVPDWAWLIRHEESIRQFTISAPWTSWFLGLAVYFGLSLVPGTAGKSILCGWLFGFWAALVMVELGLTAAAVVSFLISRLFVQEFLKARWGPRLRFLHERFERDGALYLLLLRFAHAPYTFVNYATGATKIPLRTFWWTTHVGILPGTIVFTLAGAQVPTLQIVAQRGVWAVVDVRLFLALLTTAVVPLLVRQTVRKWGRGRTLRPKASSHRE